MSVTIFGQSEFNKFVSDTKKFSQDLATNTFEFKLLKKICDAAVIKLSLSYTTIDSTQHIPAVSIEYNSNTSATLIASGEDVMFIEFGTGKQGLQSSYPGDLADSGVPITGSWVYNYPSKYKRTAKSGTIIWKIGNKALWGTTWINQNGWSRGIPSQHQIYDTCIYINTLIPTFFEELMRTYYV